MAEHNQVDNSEKLVPLLKLKYGDSIQDALAQVGDDVDTVFTDFQQYLYEVGLPLKALERLLRRLNSRPLDLLVITVKVPQNGLQGFLGALQAIPSRLAFYWMLNCHLTHTSRGRDTLMREKATIISSTYIDIPLMTVAFSSLLEEVLVDLLDLVGLTNGHTQVLIHHEGHQSRPVNQDETDSNLLCVLLRTACEVGRGDEHSPLCLSTLKSSHEGLDVGTVDRRSRDAALGLHPNKIKPERILVNDPVKANWVRGPRVVCEESRGRGTTSPDLTHNFRCLRSGQWNIERLTGTVLSLESLRCRTALPGVPKVASVAVPPASS